MVKIGIGGGLGPVRAGVSNRGFGGGLGPLSVGGSWGRGGGGLGPLVVFVVALALVVYAVYLVAAWPWLLGAHVAESNGAGNPSSTRTAVAWVFESAYILAIVGGLGYTARRRVVRARVAEAEARERQAEAQAFAEHQRQVAQAEAKVARFERAVDILRRGIETEQQGVEVATRLLKAMRKDPPEGQDADDYIARGWPIQPSTRVFGTLTGVPLFAPRVAYTGGPKVQKRIDSGELLIASDSLHFRSDTRIEEWSISRITNVAKSTDGDGVLFLISLAGRKTVQGFQAAEGIIAAISEGLLEWARAYPVQPTTAIVAVEAALVEAGKAIERCEAELDDMLSELDGAATELSELQ